MTTRLTSGHRGPSVSFPKNAMHRDERYLAFVRTHRCCACHRPPPSEAHHYGPHGVGQKTDDARTVPLCRECHREWTDTNAIARVGASDRELTPRRATMWLFDRVMVELLVGWMKL